jgi:hypothetical protein
MWVSLSFGSFEFTDSVLLVCAENKTKNKSSSSSITGSEREEPPTVFFFFSLNQSLIYSVDVYIPPRSWLTTKPLFLNHDQQRPGSHVDENINAGQGKHKEPKQLFFFLPSTYQIRKQEGGNIYLYIYVTVSYRRKQKSPNRINFPSVGILPRENCYLFHQLMNAHLSYSFTALLRFVFFALSRGFTVPSTRRSMYILFPYILLSKCFTPTHLRIHSTVVN